MTDPELSVSSGPPRGWYPDPAQPGRERLWDGQRWSDQVRLPPGSPPPVTGLTSTAPASTGPVPVAVPPVTRQPERGRQPAATTADNVPLASWGLRLVGSIIDFLIVWTLSMLALNLTVADAISRFQREAATWAEQTVTTGSWTAQPPGELQHLAVLMTIAYLSVALVYGLVCLLIWSASLGQRVLGMRVVPLDQGKARITARAAVVRSLAWALLSSGYGLFQVLQIVNGLMPLWHPRRQGLHDLLSRTQVVWRP